MAHIAINFHYVGMPELPHPGVYGDTCQAFRECIEELGRSLEFLSLSDIISATRGEHDLPANACVVTFDDGLRCQYEQALPVLDDLGVPAAFFASCAPYAQKRGCQVHKIHWVRGNLGDRHLCELIDDMHQRGEVPSRPSDVPLAEALVCNLLNAPETAQLKFYLNFVLPERLVSKILAGSLEKLGLTEAGFAEFYYLSPAMLREMAERSLIGSHAISHRPLSRMTDDEIGNELRESRRVLEDITRCTITGVSYPYGTPDAVDRRVADGAAAAGFEIGYTMEVAANADTGAPLLYARIDASDVPKIPDLPARSPHVGTSGTRSGVRAPGATEG